MGICHCSISGLFDRGFLLVHHFLTMRTLGCIHMSKWKIFHPTFTKLGETVCGHTIPSHIPVSVVHGKFTCPSKMSF